MIKYSFLLLTIGLLNAPLSGFSYSTTVSYLNENQHSNQDSLIFKNGREAYGVKMRDIKYPMSVAKKGVQGTMIFKLTIKPDGVIHGLLLTDLGDDINQSVANLIYELKDQFLAKEEEYSIYQTIFFSIHHDYFVQFKEEVTEFKKSFSFPWLEPVMVTVKMGMSISPMMGVNSSNGNSFRPSGSQNPSEGYQLKVYRKGLKQYNKFSDKGKVKKAYKVLPELIRFNPFDIKLIQARRRIEKELGVNTFAGVDLPLAITLAEVK